MIHTARKLFTLLLILTFMAGFSQPLVWCVSGTDHSRVEFKIGGNGHETMRSNAASEALSAHIASSAKDKFKWRNCLDRDYFPEVVEAPTADPDVTLQSPAPWDMPPPARAPAMRPLPAATRTPPPVRREPAQLTHIRTVVLLI